MTRRETLSCVHEPFGDSYYYGPERLGSRFENDPAERENSGFSNITYKDIVDRIDTVAKEVRTSFSPLA